MKKSNVMRFAIVTAFMAPALSVPLVVQAGTSASLGVASMYLWRGQDVSAASPQVSGSLQHNHDSGAYFGAWTSSMWNLGGTNSGYELDLYAGYGGSVGDIGYDISYVNYLYPEAGLVDAKLTDTNATEIVISVSYDAFSLSIYQDIDAEVDNYTYINLGYSIDKYSVNYGKWTFDDAATDAYGHLTVGYAATDALTFTVNFTQSDNGTTEEGPLVQVSYGWDFDL